MMMKNIQEFVIKDYPRNDEDVGMEDNIVSMLKDVYMNPMERALIIRKLEVEKKKDKFQLSYVSDLVIEWLIFHKDNIRIPIILECIGMDSIDIGKLLNGFKLLFPTYDFIEYEGTTIGAYSIGCIGVAKGVLDEMELTIDEYHLKFSGRMMYQTRLTFILEIMGEDKQKEFMWCMLYDRHHNKQGYVAFNIK